MQTDRRDAIISNEMFNHAGHINISLIANGENGGQRQGSSGKGQVAGNVARLADDGDAAFTWLDAVLIGP